jgi:myo-inositol-hexaphosphate 3-phosphohydrolase
MLLGHVYEEAYCYNTITQEEIGIWRFQYEPTCGIIGKNNDWCLVGGEILILKTFLDRTVRPIGDLKNIHEMRLTDAYTVQILTDPWSEDAAIWQLELDSNRVAPAISLWKIKDFKDYLDKPYVENVTW